VRVRGTAFVNAAPDIGVLERGGLALAASLTAEADLAATAERLAALPADGLVASADGLVASASGWADFRVPVPGFCACLSVATAASPFPGTGLAAATVVFPSFPVADAEASVGASGAAG